jgi:FixJ family two-component response regulator
MRTPRPDPLGTYPYLQSSASAITYQIRVILRFRIVVNATVCVVDGDPAVRDSLATLMRLSGHEVSTFATGREFLDAAGNDTVACVICEADLPDTTGLAVFGALTEKSPAAPFALLISQSDPAKVAEAYRAGIRNVFPKPLVHRRLLSFVSG